MTTDKQPSPKLLSMIDELVHQIAQRDREYKNLFIKGEEAGIPADLMNDIIKAHGGPSYDDDEEMEGQATV